MVLVCQMITTLSCHNGILELLHHFKHGYFCLSYLCNFLCPVGALTFFTFA